MFQPGTVFVVGAGASAEVGLPSGEKIIRMIQTSLTPDRQGNIVIRPAPLLLFVRELLEKDESEYKLCMKAAEKIIEGLPLAVSIDNFLHTHRKDKHIQIVGKLAIANAILKSEGESLLNSKGHKTIYPGQDSKKWFKKFAVKLFEGRTKYNLPQVFDGIEIICFNYDRCIEHFLRHAVRSYFSVTMEESEKIVSKLRIHHPYGTVGDLSVTKRNGGSESSREGLEFGGRFNRSQLIEASKRIRIFTEGIQDNDSLNAIRDCMAHAARVVFLGFGYIPQNMSLLQTEARNPRRRPVARGTAYGISEDDRKTIESRIWDIYRTPKGISEPNVGFDIKIESLTCADFFDQHWHELG